jgi:gliding motility-associated-like protein
MPNKNTITGILTLSLCLFFIVAGAQKQSFNWYFGNKAGISFANGKVTTLTDGAINTPEGVATISDKNGNLLFYTDGIRIWNRQHGYMLSGTQLQGHPSSTQSGVIVPQPGNDSMFYVFTVDAFGGYKGLNYSLVNMKKDNGLGDVVQLPVQLLTPTCEKITAIKHCNNKDIWVITRSNVGSAYYAWLLTASGLSATPVVSPTTNNNVYELGYLKGSPNGKKLAAANFDSLTELSDFDNVSGTVSNTIKIADRVPIAGTVVANSYGVEFSPDNKLLYISTFYSNASMIPSAASVDQFNITIHDSATIEQSHYTVTTDANIHSALQLGYDNKIYIADNSKRSLSRINTPGVQGSGCGFELNAIDLGTGICYSGLPTFIQSLFSPNYGGYNFSMAVDCEPLLKKFTINDLTYADSVKWNFGDPTSGASDSSTSTSPTHLFTAYKTYNVTLRIFKTTPCISGIDTTTNIITLSKINFSLGADKTVCENNTITLSAATAGANAYLWSNGATTPSIDVQQPGNYWCAAKINGCDYRDTVKVTKLLLPDFSLGTNTTLCINQPMILTPATDPSWQLLWQDGSSQNTYKVTIPGTYSLTATNSCGFTTKQIEIKNGICTINIPNAFTPNGDSKNDLFRISGTEQLTAFELTIYNRYGEIIFSTKDKTKGWDGTYKGKAVVQGGYSFVLQYKDATTNKTNQLKGSFILIR